MFLCSNVRYCCVIVTLNKLILLNTIQFIHKYKPLSQHFFCLGWIESANVNVPPQGWISSSNSLSVVYNDVVGLQLFDIHSCHPNQKVKIVSIWRRYFLFQKNMWNKNVLLPEKFKNRQNFSPALLIWAWSFRITPFP